MREWAWIGNSHMRFITWNQNPLCLLEPKVKRNSTHTHTQNQTLNIDSKYWWIDNDGDEKKKSNFTGKNDDEEITHVLNLLPSQSKF